jgi:hypothetical protein
MSVLRAPGILSMTVTSGCPIHCGLLKLCRLFISSSRLGMHIPLPTFLLGLEQVPELLKLVWAVVRRDAVGQSGGPIRST